MGSYIALLRAINVGGNKQVAMADLRDLLTKLGFADVQSLLQSGNLVFRGKARSTVQLERLLESEAKKRLDLETAFFVRTPEEWKRVVAGNPFPEAAGRDPSHLVVMFLKATPQAVDVRARRVGLTLLLGAATGALFLGAGGRLVMRLVALATGRFPTFSVRGTLTVVLAGAVAGAVGGLILFALARLLPRRPWLRGLTFSAVCYLVAIPGFRPPQPLVFALFAPAFLAYGFTLVVLWARLVRGPASGQSTTVSPV